VLVVLVVGGFTNESVHLLEVAVGDGLADPGGGVEVDVGLCDAVVGGQAQRVGRHVQHEDHKVHHVVVLQEMLARALDVHLFALDPQQTFVHTPAVLYMTPC